MKTYSIDELAFNPDAWEMAIRNVIMALNGTMGLKLFYARDMYNADRLAQTLNIRFDEDGRIIDGELTA